MILIIIIFLIAIISAFIITAYRAWQIRTLRVKNVENSTDITEKFLFRNIEKIVLFLVKNLVIGLVLIVVKYWFLMVTKTKKWLEESWPKVHKIFKRKPEEVEERAIKSYSFMRRIILELRSKIRKMKETIKRDHE